MDVPWENPTSPDPKPFTSHPRSQRLGARREQHRRVFSLERWKNKRDGAHLSLYMCYIGLHIASVAQQELTDNCVASIQHLRFPTFLFDFISVYKCQENSKTEHWRVSSFSYLPGEFNAVWCNMCQAGQAALCIDSEQVVEIYWSLLSNSSTWFRLLLHFGWPLFSLGIWFFESWSREKTLRGALLVLGDDSPFIRRRRIPIY